ncbi:hypothetical protein FJZ17_03530 [Candidatus Pacearchaeota archaeon]|nr:hypothetical protein [Candidatus Pacearchaeota archaeon]
MEKAKKVVWGFLVISLIVIALLYGAYLYKSNNNETLGKNILFYRYDCPHCKIVDAFVALNNITSKIEFEHLEISKPVNTQLILQAAKICKISQSDLRVPLYYDSAENKCYVGDTPIINYFKLKLNLPLNNS